MYDYDWRNRRAHQAGTLGITLDQVSTSLRQYLGVNEETIVNLSFGVISTRERSLVLPVTAMTMGKTIPGEIVFNVLEANSRIWGGEAIILDSHIQWG